MFFVFEKRLANYLDRFVLFLLFFVFFETFFEDFLTTFFFAFAIWVKIFFILKVFDRPLTIV